MPFAALCKICNKRNTDGKKDNSIAYMISPIHYSLNEEIKKHFIKFHNATPEPDPTKLSWKEDFKKEEIELCQYGDASDGRDISHLTFIFQGPAVRQYDCNNYKISVITKHHYNECINRKKDNKRIDLELCEYF